MVYFPRLPSKARKVFVDKILEVRRRKFPIIKYRHFFASVNKLSKWEKIGVCTNNGRLGLYGRRKDKKSTVAFNGAQQLQWSVLCWQTYTTLVEAVWAVAVEQSNNRQVLFSILLMHCIYGGPVYYRFRIGCHCRKVPGLFAKSFNATNWHKWWYCTTTNSASRSLLYRVQSANLKFCLLAWRGLFRLWPVGPICSGYLVV